MAAPSSKSSSIPTISSRANLNSRNSELGNPMRRSFSGNPFTKPSIVATPRSFTPNTPANSPSDFSRRNSTGGRGSVLSSRDHEDKENTKDPSLTPARVRSPASASRGSKNFMSPTISAASKMAASPKKKVLADKNEPPRSSVSLSNEKSPFRSVRFADVVEHIDAKPDSLLQENKIEASDDKEGTLKASVTSEASRSEEVHDPEVPLSSMTESKPETVTDEPDCVNLDPTFKISPLASCSWSCPTLAPLDADPSMPPYDPKNNYTSPRPQFLHYRPNPRIESYHLHKESDGRRLEESFSDTEVTEETQTEDSLKESEDATSGEMVKEEEQEEVRVSEPTPISAPLPNEETIEAKEGSKPHFFSRSKIIVLLLVLLLAGLSFSVTNSPVVDPAVFKESSFFEIYHSSEIAQTAKANLDGLARNFRRWYADSISSVSELMSNFRGGHIPGRLPYCNLTALSEDIPLEGYLAFDQSHDDDAWGSLEDRVVHIQPPEEEGQPEPEVDPHIGDALEEGGPEHEGPVSQEIEEASEEHVISEAYEEVLEALDAEVVEEDNSELKNTQEEVVVAENPHNEQQSNVHYQEQPVLVPEEEVVAEKPDNEQPSNVDYQEQPVLVPEEEVAVAKNPDNEQPSNVDYQEQSVLVPGDEETQSEVESDMVSSTNVDVIPESSEFDASAKNPDKISRETLLGIALLPVLGLVAATAFIYMRKHKSTIPSAATNVEQLLSAKKLYSTPVSVSTEKNILERPSPQNWPTEVDIAGDSCPSEMSSFEGRSSSSYSQKAQSQERKKPRKNYKRESLASSSSDFSMGSPSYGSFTTYEKISIKHGLGDEEAITPVRRSSRIRKQVTSP